MRPVQAGIVAVAAMAGLALTAGGAGAQSWYVKGFGGATFPQGDDFDVGFRGVGGGSASSGLDFDTGYVLGVAAGYMFTPSIAFELEYAYRNVDADLKDGPGVGSEFNAWMANALYYFPPVGATGAWQPYAGGGLGAADLQVDKVPSADGGDFDSDYNFAYQLIGGIAYNATPHWKINGELRIFGINDQDMENDFFSFKTTYQTFDVLVGATYAF